MQLPTWDKTLFDEQGMIKPELSTPRDISDKPYTSKRNSAIALYMRVCVCVCVYAYMCVWCFAL